MPNDGESMAVAAIEEKETRENPVDSIGSDVASIAYKSIEPTDQVGQPIKGGAMDYIESNIRAKSEGNQTPSVPNDGDPIAVASIEEKGKRENQTSIKAFPHLINKSSSMPRSVNSHIY